jgi:hypothetical protein
MRGSPKFGQCLLRSVYPHSPFIILFLFKDRISYPLWMDYFFNETSHEEFSYFPFDCLSFVLSKRRRCFLGTAYACTFRLCSISSLGTPGISASFHMNMSRLARRKLTSMISYFSPNPAPMTAVLDESPSWNWIVLRATSPVDWMLDWLAFLVGISSLAWESCAAASTSPKASGTRVVEAYWMASWLQSYDFFKSPRRVSTPLHPSILRSR